MFPLDPLWVCISVPTIIILLLILVKLRKIKINPRVSAWAERIADELASQEKEAMLPTKGIAENDLSEVRKTTNVESSEETKPSGCTKFLGYLYLRKAPSETDVPSECYNCPKLLQCLYSPRIIEKVYGE